MKLAATASHVHDSVPETVPSRPSVTEIAEREVEFVWALLQRFGVRPQDVPDAVQHVWIAVHRALPAFDPSLPLRPWLYGICLRVASDHRKRACVRRETLDPRAVDGQRLQPSDGPSPEETSAQRQFSARFETWLEALDPEHRAVFVMYEAEQLDCPEISTRLGIPVGTVHSRLHVARKRLREQADADPVFAGMRKELGR